MSGKKIGLLGGTFDPIHAGHLHLAFEVMEHFHLDEVLFCPAFTSPFKVHDQAVAAPEHRLAMAKLAVEGIENFSILEHEIAEEKISYTIETLEHLKKQTPEDQYHLILGEDVLKNFFEWKRAKDILELAPLLIGSRLGFLKKEETKIPEQYHGRIEKGFCKIHNLELSSTYLRERLQKKLYTAHLIPPKVLDYIHQNELYSLPK
ncbi:MAG: Nicotinate-nucleotide adenylyltransferase [Chlamydiia bacterium]|nr:Nicotinate-nucleotide adenylyltransferase [Chlamydiia bacterium]